MSFLNNSSAISNKTSEVFPESNPIHLFCETKEEINVPNEYGWTPLYRALISNNISAMTELLKLGADPNITNNMNETPLYQAIDNENFEAMMLLLDKGADPNICKSDGMSPLHLAIKKLAISFIGPLLDKGANPNIKNKLYQQTSLHLAIKLKLDVLIIKQLFVHKADFKIKDKYQCLPMDYCDDPKYKAAIESIIDFNNESLHLPPLGNDSSIVNIPINTETPHKSEIVSKFSTSEIVAKGGVTEFGSNTPNAFLVNQTINTNLNQLSNEIKTDNCNHNNNNNNSNNFLSQIGNLPLQMKYSSKTEIEQAKPNNLVQNINCALSSEHKLHKNNTFNNIIKSTSILNNNNNNNNNGNVNNNVNNNKNSPTKKRPHQTSTFNLSTPKHINHSNISQGESNNKSEKENNALTLDNGLASFLTINSRKHSLNNNSNVDKDAISEINPLDLINQVITTTNNSNLFSELQNNTQDLPSAQKVNTNDINIKLDIRTPEKIDEDMNNNIHNNNMQNNNHVITQGNDETLADHDLTYSKSRSHIVSELPITSIKKLPSQNLNEQSNTKRSNNINNVNNDDFDDFIEKDINNNNINNKNNNSNINNNNLNVPNLNNVINTNNQKPSTKISYHQNRNTNTNNGNQKRVSVTTTTSNTQNTFMNINANKENNKNIINIPKEMLNTQQDTSKFSSDYYAMEEYQKGTVNSKGMTQNTLNSSIGGNVAGGYFEYDVSSVSNRDMNTYSSNRNTSNVYSMNSTRPGTMHNSNYYRGTNNYNINSIKQKQLFATNQYDTQHDTKNMGNFNSYTLGVATTASNISPKCVYSKYKKSSILTDYAYKGQCIPKLYFEDGSPSNSGFANFNSNNNTLENYTEYNYRAKISSNEAKRLHEWLLSADLLCYYNTLMDQGIYEIDKCIEGIRSGDLSLNYKDIEDIGIKKPGHIYRFLLKLYCDAGLIDSKVVNYVLPNKTIGDGILRDSNVDINLGTSQHCCGCALVERKGVKELDVESWLKCKGLGHLKENFLHNGFDTFEYVIIQLFSMFLIDDSVLVEGMHIYNSNDRYKLKKAFNEERKTICEKLGTKFVEMEQEEGSRDTIEKCEMCNVF